jgi:hypothetical protein
MIHSSRIPLPKWIGHGGPEKLGQTRILAHGRQPFDPGGDEMFRNVFATGTIAVVLSAVMLPSSRADELADPFAPELQVPPISVPAPLDTPDTMARPVSSRGPMVPQTAMYRQEAAAVAPGPMAINPEAYATPMAPPAQQPGYVRLGAPLYPSPRPNIPIWSGATMITTPAFAPHEMLYPHTYRAMYPPFYHRVKGGWFVTPFGVRSHERWELQGTQVEVKYRSQPPLWVKANWHAPVQQSHGGYPY